MLVIFDCDGVLVDSEPLAAAVFSAELARLGLPMSGDECYREFHGHSLAYCFDWIERKFDCRLPDAFAAQLSAATDNTFSRKLQAVPGVEAVIKELERRHISYCVASNGGHKKIANSLATTGLVRYFNRDKGNCFSVDDVATGKPAPDLFLYAAESMGVPPAFTTVIEDSAAGVRAAKRAGMALFVYDPMENFAAETGLRRFFQMQDLLAQLLPRGC
ncbi:HAD family hydrolase [Teredinibacter turnerae]|uniref:HAD family hydrolase n=1 Tax=Teredinibacter turnerae TaxID=2426 RepID=UPI0004055062|nr:HAD family phosphatase [Teredinibacter turnerae]